MARKKIAFNIKRTRNTQPRTKKPKIIDMKHIGQEPAEGVLIESSASSEFASALNWYNYFYEAEDCKAWLLDYMAAHEYTKQQIAWVRSVKVDYVPRSIGTMAYLIDVRGWTFPEDSLERFKQKINTVMQRGRLVKEEVQSNVISIQDRVANKARDFATMAIDEHIDRFYEDKNYTFSLYDQLQAETVSPAGCNLTRERVQKHLDELTEEGYEHLTKRELAKYQKFFGAMIEDLDRYQMNKKAAKPRKPRTVKEKPATKLVEKVNYQKEYAPLRLVSVSPDTVIGAETLWTFNTKYKQLTVLHAKAGQTLSIKGTTVINFDEVASITKRVRKPDSATQSVLSAGKVALRKLMDQFNSKPSVAKGRLGSDTILLRVIKA